jgi:hypothetical protein
MQMIFLSQSTNGTYIRGWATYVELLVEPVLGNLPPNFQVKTGHLVATTTCSVAFIMTCGDNVMCDLPAVFLWSVSFGVDTPSVVVKESHDLIN